MNRLEPLVQQNKLRSLKMSRFFNISGPVGVAPTMFECYNPSHIRPRGAKPILVLETSCASNQLCYQ